MAPRTGGRRAYIDWFRGVAVVVMIFAHTTDAWTRPADRATWLFHLCVRVSGMAAPLFLFLAGVSVALAAGAGVRGGATVARASAAVRRRGWEILGLGLLFRLQALVLNPGAPLAGLLKVDILNIMGPSMVVAAAIWGSTRRSRLRFVMLAAAATAFSLFTPAVRASTVLSALPDWLEWYLRSPPGRSWFTMFPWAGLLVAGTVIGELIDRVTTERGERQLQLGLAVGGTGLFAASLGGSFLPPLLANTSFWTTSPSYFFLRIGLMTALLPLAWAWCRRLPAGRFSPMLQFGRTSLFVYWIHVELAYGMLSTPLHRALPLAWVLFAFVAFTGLMLWASVAKDRWVARRRAGRQGALQPAR